MIGEKPNLPIRFGEGIAMEKIIGIYNSPSNKINKNKIIIIKIMISIMKETTIL